MNLNFNYKNVFLAIVAAIMLSIPTAAALNSRDNALDVERTKSNQLNIDIQKRDTELKKTIDDKVKTEKQLEQERQEREKTEKENERLKRELQAKRERKAEEARVAAAQREREAQAAVVVSQAAPRRVAAATSGDCYLSELSKYDWDVGTMQRIMRAESGCNPTNHNHADNHRSCLGSYGLMQIGCVHGYSASYLENPTNNIAAAYKIWRSQGYTAWTTY